MATKHTPATTLPFEYFGPNKFQLYGGDPKRRIAVIDFTNGDTIPDREQDAAYIAHAANAYPKLVEAIKAWLPADESEYGTQDVAMRALLREIGEDA